MLERNISGERFIGMNQRLDENIANQLANIVRQRGYNARVINSKNQKRLYIGNPRTYYKKQGRITDLTARSNMGENYSAMKTVAPSNLGSYDRAQIKRDEEYVLWKTNTYRRNPNLRYIALGAVDRAEFPRTSTSRPYLLALGLMPSNVALLYLAELGAPIGPGTDIYSWYNTDRRNLGEEWHRGNMRQISWHLDQKYRTSYGMSDLYDSLNFDGYAIGYKISGSDLEINTDDGIDMENSKQRILEQDEQLKEKYLSGYVDPSLFSFEGGSTLFDMDFRKRALRLSDWLPDVELYLNQMEIRDLIKETSSKMQGVDVRVDGNSIPPLAVDARRSPTKSIYLSDDQPDYEAVLNPYTEPAFTNQTRFGREVYNDFTYDWLNLQRQQWGGGEAGRGVEQSKLLPYARPSLLTAIREGTLGEKIESLDWLPEVENSLDLLRRINILNVAQVEANSADEIKNAKSIVDDAMALVSNYTVLTNQRLGEGAGLNWPGALNNPFDTPSSGWEFTKRGVGFSGTPDDQNPGTDFYSNEAKVGRLVADYL